MTAQPRVLIAGNQVPHLHTPSAILIYRLFKDWAPDRLMALGPDYHPEAQRLPCRYVRWDARWTRLHHTRFHRAARTLQATGMLPLDSPRALAEMLDGFQPDVVVSLMEFQRYYSAAYELARFLRRPFVLMVHDMPELFEQRGSIEDWAHDRRAARTYRMATECLPISDAMEAELFRRWGRHGTVLHPIPSDDEPSDPLNRRQRNGAFTVGYAGSLDSRYGPLLESFARAIEGTPITLNIYSAMSPAWIGTVRNAAYRGHHTPSGLWPLVVAECDALLLPYQATTERDALMLKYSFPSKLPEYMRLGLPIVVAVPDESAAAEWTRQHADAFEVCAADGASIARACEHLRIDAALCELRGAAAKALFQLHFNPVLMRDRFQQLIRRLAAGRAGNQNIRD